MSDNGGNNWNTLLLDMVPKLTAVIVLILLIMIVVTNWSLLKPVEMTEETIATAYVQLVAKQMAIRSMQITAAYSLGFVCVLLGVLSCWNSVRGDVDLSVGNDKLTFSVKTAQVGVIILLCGVALIALGVLSPPTKVQAPQKWRPESLTIPDGGNATIPTIEI